MINLNFLITDAIKLIFNIREGLFFPHFINSHKLQQSSPWNCSFDHTGYLSPRIKTNCQANILQAVKYKFSKLSECGLSIVICYNIIWHIHLDQDLLANQWLQAQNHKFKGWVFDHVSPQISRLLMNKWKHYPANLESVKTHGVNQRQIQEKRSQPTDFHFLCSHTKSRWLWNKERELTSPRIHLLQLL